MRKLRMTDPIEARYDYSLKSYADTLKAYRQSGYAVSSFARYLSAPEAKHLILRHDIDNSIEQALRVARIDAEAGCTSTFRGTSFKYARETSSVTHEGMPA